VTAVVIVVVAVVVVVAIVVALVLRARRPDTVEVFQRQIDALSPEARKPVVEQLQQLDEQGDEEVPQGPEEAGPPPAEDDKGGG
jgi:flagellar biosynthesis/type III secretory pathway M-ring protein FliF/YscJ